MIATCTVNGVTTLVLSIERERYVWQFRHDEASISEVYARLNAWCSDPRLSITWPHGYMVSYEIMRAAQEQSLLATRWG